MAACVSSPPVIVQHKRARASTMKLEDNLQVGDVFHWADRLYSGYEQIREAPTQGCPTSSGRDATERAINRYFRRGKKIGPDDRLVVWRKVAHKTKGSHLEAQSEWEALPEAR